MLSFLDTHAVAAENSELCRIQMPASHYLCQSLSTNDAYIQAVMRGIAVAEKYRGIICNDIM